MRADSPCTPESVVNPESARVLLRVDEPQFNHNAGAVVFGADAVLYVAFGDDGAADDQGVGRPGHALPQPLTVVVGGKSSLPNAKRARHNNQRLLKTSHNVGCSPEIRSSPITPDRAADGSSYASSSSLHPENCSVMVP